MGKWENHPDYPLVNLQVAGRDIPMFNRTYIFNPGPFSIAMLGYRSVSKIQTEQIPSERFFNQQGMPFLVEKDTQQKHFLPRILKIKNIENEMRDFQKRVTQTGSKGCAFEQVEQELYISGPRN